MLIDYYPFFCLNLFYVSDSGEDCILSSLDVLVLSPDLVNHLLWQQYFKTLPRSLECAAEVENHCSRLVFLLHESSDSQT